jgi:predicted TIM-barrel fold metal-dependent hydrolase
MIAMSVIDAHAHLGDFPLFGESLDVVRLLRIMGEYDIGMAVVSSLPNTLTLEAVRKYPDRISGLVRVNPFDDETVELIGKAVDDWGFKGIKMNPLFNNFLPDSEVVYLVMEAASHHSIPVLIHCGHPPWSLPWSFERLADRFPDVIIIMAHMGHGHIVYINGSLDVAEDHDNIAVDTAGVTMHSKIKEAVERLGDDRVMYGSDVPFGHPAWEIPKVRTSGLSEEHLQKVLHDNAKEIFKL